MRRGKEGGGAARPRLGHRSQPLLPPLPPPHLQGVTSALASATAAAPPAPQAPGRPLPAVNDEEESSGCAQLPPGVPLTYTLFPVADDGGGGALGCLDAVDAPPQPAAGRGRAAAAAAVSSTAGGGGASLRAQAEEWSLTLRLVATEAVALARTETAFEVIRESGTAALGAVGGPIGAWEEAAASAAAAAVARQLELADDGEEEGGAESDARFSLKHADAEIAAEGEGAGGGVAADLLRLLPGAADRWRGEAAAASRPIHLTLRSAAAADATSAPVQPPKANAGALADLRDACAVLQVRGC